MADETLRPGGKERIANRIAAWRYALKGNLTQEEKDLALHAANSGMSATQLEKLLAQRRDTSLPAEQRTELDRANQDRTPIAKIDAAPAVPAVTRAKPQASPFPRTVGSYYIDRQGTNLGPVTDAQGNTITMPKGAVGIQGTPAQTPATSAPPSEDLSMLTPALRDAYQRHIQAAGGTTWQERYAANANAAVQHFSNEPQMIHYHWYAGGADKHGGPGMFADFSDGSSRWISTSTPGEIPPSAPTTYDKQLALTRQALANPDGGIIPPWNSPTGKAIDTSTGQEVAFSDPKPPAGWLNRAIAAARSGASTYDTGDTTGQQFGKGAVRTTAQGRTLIGTPSGGSIGLPSAAESARAKVETADRAGIYDAIQKTQQQRGYFPAGKTGEEYRGRNLIGQVIQ